MAIKTKNSIVKSFYKLLEKKSIEEITVTDLVEKCNISRQTFYYHFNDIYSMIEWIFRDNVSKSAATIDKSNSLAESVKAYGEFIKPIHPLIVASLNTEYFTDIYNLIHNSYKQLSDRILKKHYHLNDAAQQYSVVFWASALCGLTVNEAQKSKPDYDRLIKILTATMPRSRQ